MPSSSSTLCPYTTLFRSEQVAVVRELSDAAGLGLDAESGRVQARARHGVGAGGDHGRPVGLELVGDRRRGARSEEHTAERQSLRHTVCRLPLEKKKENQI